MKIILMRCNFRAAMFDPDPHIQRRSERCRTQSRERNREGPEHTDYGRKKKIPIEAMRDPPPPAKAPRKTSIRMDFIRSDLNAIFSSDNVVTMNVESARIKSALPSRNVAFTSVTNDLCQFRLKHFDVIYVHQSL